MSDHHAAAPAALSVGDLTLEQRDGLGGLSIHLPARLDAERVSPNVIIRSALFGVVRRGRRDDLDNAIIASWPGVVIRYSGTALDQGDCDVWMTALELNRDRPLGSPIEFSLYQFLKHLGRSTGKSDREWLKRSLQRMQKCYVEIETDEYIYSGQLIGEFLYDKNKHTYILVLNNNIGKLFQNDDYTKVEWLERRSLSTDLARWLHLYISSHRTSFQHPHSVSLDQLQQLCGSKMSHKRNFRAKLRETMLQLEEKGIVTQWSIDEDILRFTRSINGLSKFCPTALSP